MMNGFRSILSAGLIGAGLAVVAGCSSSGRTGGGERLTAADFASDAQETASISAAKAPAEPVVPADPPQPVNITGPVAVSEGVVDVVASAGAPELPKGPRPEPVGGAILIDAKIGDVNGRPIYASKFLEPMADHLRAKAVDFE